jgi:hypothetical protein
MNSKLKFSLVALVTAVLTASVMAETYNMTLGGTDGYSATLASPRFFVLERTIDFADRNVTTNDVVESITVVKNSRVVSVQAEVLEASTTNTNTTQTVKVGDGADDDGWLASVNMLSASSAMSSPVVSVTGPQSTNLTVSVSPAFAMGKYYTANDTIDIKANGVLVDGKIRLRVAVIDFTK